MSNIEFPELLSVSQAADLLGMSDSWLNKNRWSIRCECIPYVKIGKRVRYRKTDLIVWVNQQAVAATQRRSQTTRPSK